MPNAANRQGIVREFHRVWIVVTLSIVLGDPRCRLEGRGGKVGSVCREFKHNDGSIVG